MSSEVLVDTEPLSEGRAASADRRWSEAHALLSAADAKAALDAEDRELLATAAYLVGHEDAFVRHLERAHEQHLESGRPLRAARCALWAGLVLALRGEIGPANGWFGRARRLVATTRGGGVDGGYVRLPELLGQVADADWDAVVATAEGITRIAERFGDRDLLALATHEHGHALVRLGRPTDGFALLDDAMLAATNGELSPVVTGLVYCGVIAYCHDLHDLQRAREWTAALTRWCDDQPQLVAYTGLCQVHRAEILEAGGAWPDALDEARRAEQRLREADRTNLEGYARYRQGELHRLRGEFRAAETAYRDASRLGWPPQPGLALLRLAEDQGQAAAVAIRRTLLETIDPLDRAWLLPACVQIHLAVGDLARAEDACRELEAVAEAHQRTVLEAAAAGARGALALAEHDAPEALVSLRRGWQLWHELDVPYEAARLRVLVGSACRALGDDEAATLELTAARESFAVLGAHPDVARVGSLLEPGVGRSDHPLSPRELEVLRLVAAGTTNRAIAAELVLSERTVDRHVSNILAKLGVPSRAAATASAYELGLL